MRRLLGSAFSVAVLLAAVYAFSPRALPEFPATGLRIDTVLVQAAARAGSRLVAVGERGHVFLSDDEGKTWRAVKSPVDVTLTALYFFDARHGWAAGHDAAILRTEDGGETWRVAHLALQDERPLLAIRFRDAHNGIAVGAYGTFLESRDGGRSWNARKILDDDRHLNALAAGSDGRHFIAGESGVVLYSADNGAQWTRLQSPYKGSYFGVLAIGATDLIAFGLRGNMYRSADLGQAWNAIANTSRASLMGSQLLATDRAVLVGQDGTVLLTRDSGRTFTRHRDPGGAAFAAALPAPDGDLLVFGERGVTRITGIAKP